MDEILTLQLTSKQLSYLSNLLVDVFRFEDHLLFGVLHCGSKQECLELYEQIGAAILRARGVEPSTLYLPWPKGDNQ